MTTAADSALRAKSITPAFTAGDLQRSIRFYENLGFVVEDRWENGGVLHGVMMRAGEVQVGLTQDDWKKGRDRMKGQGMRISIETDHDVDQLAARVKSAGISLDSEPHDTRWGNRAFGVTDPDGFMVTISRKL